MYNFIPINGPLIHWAVSSPSYLSSFSVPIDSWAHLQHSVTYGPLLSFFACGSNSARRYSRPVCGPLIRWAVFTSKKPVGLFSQSYQIRPINGPLWSMNSTAHDWRNDDTPRRRPMDPTARMRPMDSTARRGPMDRTTRKRPMEPMARRRPIDP